MASAAGGSGAGGGDRCPSGEKGTTQVVRRSKKPSAFHRAALRYLEKKNIENAWQGARHLRLILRINDTFRLFLYNFIVICKSY